MSGETRPLARRLPTALVYLAMIAVAVVVYQLVRQRGASLVAPPPTGGALFGVTVQKGGVDTLVHVLLALAVVIFTARTIGALFKRFAQPPVVGEILAGILLGPSLLGRVAPHIGEMVLPQTVAPFLQVIAQVGVILYMFLVGLELDPGLLRQRGHATIAISHASIIAPFLLGAGLALYAYPRLSSSDVPFSSFALFLSVSMSVTAFPVLARILTDRQIHKTRMGVIALTCAAVDDVTAWCLLAFVVSVVQARVASALVTVALALGYIALMVLVVRPAMARLARVWGNNGRLTQGLMAAVFVALLLSSLATDLIGIHAVFGAFALGAVIPHDSGMARELTDRLEDLVVVLLLPAFFAFTGMRTQIGLVSGAGEWGVCGLILLVACVGKFGGSALAARLTGLGWRDAAALGVLMNTRGLMELIVLNIGLELHVISPTLFAMLVLMAVTTTVMTTPLLTLITRGHRFEDDQPAVVKPVVDVVKPVARLREGGVLVPVSNPETMELLVELALAATRPTDPAPQVMALVRLPGGGIRSGLRELDGREAPHAPILTGASAHAAHLGGRVMTRALWTDDPAHQIVGEAVARRASLGWLLLGFHRPVFGADALGGVVAEVLERLDRDALHVGVVVTPPSPTSPSRQRGTALGSLEKLVAVVDDSNDGRASLELAGRVARHAGAALHAVLVPRAGSEPEPGLQESLKETAREAGRWLHTDVIDRSAPASLAARTAGDVVFIGVALAAELGFAPDEGDHRCVVLVRGAASRE